ncbi:FtsX-like permease family protein [uncultured Brachyspira sp.]|uniref:ABC transporter permease n=1 Tax=uncultured Brachyspira sp. TaxID=221953 RepID=UPI00320A49EB
MIYYNIFYKNVSLAGGYLYGIEQNYLDTCDFILREGRGFDKEDYKKQRKVALLDSDSEQTLFQGESAVGKTIEINKEPFTVIGIAQKLEEFEPTINSFEEYNNYKGNESLGVVYIPSACWCIPYQYDEPQNVVVRASSTETMTKVGQKSADILNGYMNVKEDDVKYKATNVLELAAQIQSSSATMNTQLIWIASISLLVGGIGVMNIMLVSVTERTKEIGLKKAIGARKKVILGQFLTEAAVLTSVGGIIGVVLGIGLSKVVSKVAGSPTAISVPAIIGSVVFSMLIGIIFGLLPSVKAANLNPIDALRSE